MRALRRSRPFRTGRFPAGPHSGRKSGGKWFEKSGWTPKESQDSKMEYSPGLGAAIAQDRLEPILREKAIELGADIRLNT